VRNDEDGARLRSRVFIDVYSDHRRDVFHVVEVSMDETVNTLKAMLAEKNDSIVVKDDSIQQLTTTLAQLQKKNSDDNTVIAQLQTQVNSWTSQKRKDLAGAYNDMDAGAAAKIMRNLSDGDVIFILSSVQKKQAAKILGELDPARAAKLMTSLGHTK